MLVRIGGQGMERLDPEVEIGEIGGKGDEYWAAVVAGRLRESPGFVVVLF